LEWSAVDDEDLEDIEDYCFIDQGFMYLQGHWFRITDLKPEQYRPGY